MGIREGFDGAACPSPPKLDSSPVACTNRVPKAKAEAYLPIFQRCFADPNQQRHHTQDADHRSEEHKNNKRATKLLHRRDRLTNELSVARIVSSFRIVLDLSGEIATDIKALSGNDRSTRKLES